MHIRLGLNIHTSNTINVPTSNIYKIMASNSNVLKHYNKRFKNNTEMC